MIIFKPFFNFSPVITTLVVKTECRECWLPPQPRPSASASPRTWCRISTTSAATSASATSCGSRRTCMSVRDSAKVCHSSISQMFSDFFLADFFIHLDQECGPLTLHSSLKDLVNYTRKGLASISDDKKPNSGVGVVGLPPENFTHLDQKIHKWGIIYQTLEPCLALTRPVMFPLGRGRPVVNLLLWAKTTGCSSKVVRYLHKLFLPFTAQF